MKREKNHAEKFFWGWKRKEVGRKNTGKGGADQKRGGKDVTPTRQHKTKETGFWTPWGPGSFWGINAKVGGAEKNRKRQKKGPGRGTTISFFRNHA